MITSVDNTILKARDGLDSRFIVFLMSSSPWLRWVETLCRVGGGFRYRVSRTMLGELRVALPPTREQQAISGFLSHETAKLDRMTARIQAAIERLQEYRTVLITSAVTGKIDVREAAA